MRVLQILKDVVEVVSFLHEHISEMILQHDVSAHSTCCRRFASFSEF